MSTNTDLLRCLAIEIAHGGNRKIWQADDLTDEDMAAFAAAGVTLEQAQQALEIRQPYVPAIPARTAKRYRDMDDDEFDRTWDDERGNQAGVPL